MFYLYRITNLLNNKVYIGQSNKETERWRQHKYFARQEKPIRYIHRAMAKYGVENFIYEVIASCKSQEDSNELETQLIIQYQSRDKKYGYNKAPGGNIAFPAGMPSHMYPMYGKHHSEETKQYMSNLFKGKRLAPVPTEETKQKMSKSQMGHAVLPETAEKISKAHIGKVRSKEHSKNISNAKIGTKLSEETKKKMSDAHSGKIISEETKKKMSKNHSHFHKGLTWKIIDGKRVWVSKE